MRFFSASIVIRSPFCTSAIGPPSWASGVTWPTMKPCEPPENRPSVISATSLPKPGAHDGRSRRQHLGHSRPALGPFVANDDRRRPLTISFRSRACSMSSSESKTWPGPLKRQPFFAGDLGHGAVGREVAAQDLDVAGRLDRLFQRLDDLLPGFQTRQDR